jgi:hypothetical protein
MKSMIWNDKTLGRMLECGPLDRPIWAGKPAQAKMTGPQRRAASVVKTLDKKGAWAGWAGWAGLSHRGSGTC